MSLVVCVSFFAFLEVLFFVVPVVGFFVGKNWWGVTPGPTLCFLVRWVFWCDFRFYYFQIVFGGFGLV